MDTRGFDTLIRAFGASGNRRAALRVLAAGIAGSVGLAAGPDAAAKKKKKKCKPPTKKCGKKCCAPGSFCNGGRCSACFDQCAGMCCAVAETCEASACAPCPDLADSCDNPVPHCDNAVPGHFCATSVEGGSFCAVSTQGQPYACTANACTTDAACETALGVPAICIACGQCASGTACARILPE